MNEHWEAPCCFPCASQLGASQGFMRLTKANLAKLSLPAGKTESIVFDEDHQTKWTRALAKIGVRADHLSAQAGSA